VNGVVVNDLPKGDGIFGGGPLDESLLVGTSEWFATPSEEIGADVVQLARFLFVRRLIQVSRRWRNRLSYRLRSLTPDRAGWQSLFWLSLVGEVTTQRNLSKRVGIKESTLARALDALERQGLVSRASAPNNRRANLVTLTPAAMPVLDEINAAAKAIRDELLSDVDPQELAICVKVLAQINEAFDRTTD